MAEQKKAPITLAEMHRAAHASRNLTEDRYDDLIEKAKESGKTDHAKGLESSRDGCLAALDAQLKVWDVLIEFSDDFRPFYRDLLDRQRLKIQQEEEARAKGGRAIHQLRTGTA